MLRLGALLHDIGKLSVPPAVLLKPGPLNEVEYGQVRRHPGHLRDPGRDRAAADRGGGDGDAHADQPPRGQGDRRILENSSSLGGELPTSVDTLALPLALILEEHNVSATASWTGHLVIGPAEMNHVIQSIVRIAKVLDGLLKGTWVFHSRTRLPGGV